jgi:hypothetical protein
MLSDTPLTKTLGALLVLVAATATGCGGCNDSTVQCDENGANCLICDGYGCHPADPDPGAGGAGQGNTGQGGAGDVEPACDASLTTCPCDESDECEGGTRCIDGLCIAGCDFSYECGADRVCVNGQCAAGCDGDTPCAQPGTVCDKGVCVVDPANPACSDTKPCGSAGEICVGGLCTTPCQANADCADGEICSATTGACIADPSPQPGCGSTTCSAQLQQCMADGYCHYPCDTTLDCQRIDTRLIECQAGICKTREELAPECTVDRPCPNGEDCISNECL